MRETPAFRIDNRIASEIVRRTTEIVGGNVNVMDARGIIIASGDATRLGDLHEGALLALMQRRVMEIDAAVSDRLHGVRPGINLPLRCDGEFVGVVGLTGEPETLRSFGELVRMAAEMMLEQSRLTGLLSRDTRLREELVLTLVREDASHAALEDWARRLGIDLNQARVAAVIELDSHALGVDATANELQRLQTLLTEPERGNLFAIVSMAQMVVLKPVEITPAGWNLEEHRERVHALLARLRRDSTLGVRIALGNYFPGPGGLARSFYTAQTAMKTGKRRHPAQAAFFYADLALPVLLDGLGEGWRAEELRRPLARLYAEDRNGLLRRTLRSWFAHHLQAGATAQALHIHRNTLDYRLARIAELTGMNLGHFEERLRLYLALEFELRELE